MRLDNVDDHNVRATVSRRNLLTLLGKVNNPASHATLTVGSPTGHLLSLKAEPDDTHYDRPPGRAQQDAGHILLVARDLVAQINEAVGPALDDDLAHALALEVRALDLLAEDLKGHSAVII